MTPATHATQVEGAQGPLSPARSRAILTELERGADDTNIFDRHLALEQAVSDSPLLTGNRVRLLEDGPETYRAMFTAILAARDHINMETYILEDDEVGRRFADALIEKQRQGVQVNLIHDSVGTLGTPAEFFQRLRDSGIRTLEYNPVNPATAKAGLGREPARSPQAADRRWRRRFSSAASTSAACTPAVRSAGPVEDSSGRAAAVARHRPADRGPGRRRIPEAVPGDLAGRSRASRWRRATSSRRCSRRATRSCVRSAVRPTMTTA